MNKDSKINIVEAVLIGIALITADAIEAISVLAISLPVIGQILPIIAWIYGFSISIIIIFLLIIKGVSIKWFLGGGGLELIPLISSLPARSAAFAMTLIIDWGPEKVKRVAGAATGKPTIAKS